MTVPWSSQPVTYTEISLHGQVPAARHHQLMQILAGLTAMKPKRLIERHLIYAPTRGSVQRIPQVGGSQDIQDAAKRAMSKARGETADVFFLRLVEELGVGANNEVDLGADPGEYNEPRNVGDLIDGLGTQNIHENDSSWSLRLYGLPEAGKRNATVRIVMTEALSSGYNKKFLEAAGYSFVSEYIIEGHQFVQNNTILLLHRVLSCQSRNAGNTLVPKLGVPLNSMPALSSCTPFDTSGAYVLEGKVRVQDGKHLESMTRGTQELMGLKERMRGIVDLRVVDRLALDTRVK